MTISLQSKARIIFGGETVLMGAMMIRAILLARNPMRYFGEGGVITWLSALQLLWLGYLAWAIAQLRQPSKAAPQSQAKSQGQPKVKHLWQIMAVGFVFLALDEQFQIHERLDIGTISDWLWFDDVIVLLYALGGLLFLWAFRQERSLLSQASGWFQLGVGLSFVTIALDILTHTSSILVPFFQDPEQLKTAHAWSHVLEEIPKIFAEGAFMMALYRCLFIAQQSRSAASMAGSSAASHEGFANRTDCF